MPLLLAIHVVLSDQQEVGFDACQEVLDFGPPGGDVQGEEGEGVLSPSTTPWAHWLWPQLWQGALQQLPWQQLPVPGLFAWLVWLPPR